MPIAVAMFVRALIQAVVSTGILLLAENLLYTLLDKAKAALQSEDDMTEEEATDTIANEVIDALLTIGLLTFAVKSKIPTRLAERLGFTSKGWTKRPISPKAKTGAPGSTARTVSAKPSTPIITATEATGVIAKAKVGVRGFSKAFKFLEGRLNSLFLAFLVFGNFIDFGNWETGAYSDTFQKILAFVTGGILVPNEDYRKSRTASPEVFQKVYDSYILAGAVSLSDPYKLQSVTFTRDNLMDIVDMVGAQLLVTTGSASTKEVITATQMLVIFGPDAGANIPASTPVYVAPAVRTVQAPTATPKVYTGIISQGVVGKAATFKTRADDLIETRDELLQAAANNLTPYLAFLLSRVVYELKIVSSIVTKEGFRQTGSIQQVQSGTYADGRPKYKTVSNKFAVLDVFVMTDKGTRSKVTSIVLGPTNSATLTLASFDLRSVEASLPELVTTSNVEDITGIETSAPITVTTPGQADARSAAILPGTAVTTTTVNAGVSAVQKPVAGLSASTLSEWYAANSQPLPSLSIRSRIYEQHGLGKAAYYTGTAEQNTKLLASLKAEAVGDAKKATTTNTASTKVLRSDDPASDSTSTTYKPKLGMVDDTGKTIAYWAKQSDGDYFIRYTDKSTRIVKRKDAE